LAFDFKKGVSLPKAIPLIGGRYGYKITGSLAGKLEDCKVSITGKLGETAGAASTPDGVKLEIGKNMTFGGSVGLAANWIVVCEEGQSPDWGFDAANLKFEGGGTGKIPAIDLDFWVAHLDVGVEVQALASLEFNWKGGNFPSLPSFGGGELNVRLGPYGKASLAGGAVEAAITGSGYVKVGFLPEAKLREYGLTFKASAKALFLSYSFEKTWKKTYSRDGLEPHFTRELLDPDTLRITRTQTRGGVRSEEVLVIRKQPYLGTPNDYSEDSAHPVEAANVLVADLQHDVHPSMAANSDGSEVLATWVHDSGNSLRDVGTILKLASFDGTSWTPQAEIMGADYFNRNPVLRFDTNDEPWIVWAAAPAMVSIDSPIDEIVDATHETDIWVSHRVGGVWSEPIALTSQAGEDAKPDLAILPDGDLYVGWIHREPNDGGEMVYALHYDAQSGEWADTPELLNAVTRSTHEIDLISDFALGVTPANAPVATWVQTINPQADQPIHVLVYTVKQGAAWSAPMSFTKQTRRTEEREVRSRGRNSVIPFRPSEECAKKCKDCKNNPDAEECKRDKPEAPDPDPVKNSPSGTPVQVVAACDPNEKMGPQGVGDQHAIAADAVMNYTILFENKPSATAPASTVLVTDVLDDNLDPRRFRLGEIAFGDTIIQIPDNSPFFFKTIALENGMDLLVLATIDPVTKIASWELRTIDPATGQTPANPMLGFLPPNDENHIGEGRVTFIIAPAADVPDGTVIRNQASIIFDANEAILTNETDNLIADVAFDSQVQDFSGDPADGEDVFDGEMLTVNWELA
ncbi:MAG: exo-alpha-sialidase, partial [Lentisphaeria bacterium]|nr:exo-alpha-sialidase [Lentisphaeria bacterium]